MNNKIEKVFKNKTVFVTGHTGFIGTWLTLWLTKLGAKVIGFSLPPPTAPSFFNEINLKEKIIHIIGDIRNYDNLNSKLNEFSPEFVFHLAAQPLVLKSYDEPLQTFETNILGVWNLFESIRKLHSIQACINFTSDKCYRNSELENSSFKESDPLGGKDPYSASKAASELVSNAYTHSFFKSSENPIEVSTFRAGNVIGGGDWAPDRIVPDCIRALIKEKEIKIRNPNSIRPWQFVLEPISVILWLTVKMKDQQGIFSGPWNIGPDEQNVSVKNLIELIIKKWGNGTWSSYSKNNTQYEAKFLSLDCSKAKKRLGWKPTYSMEETVQETVNWYKAFNEKQKMYEFSIQQIENFCNNAKENKLEWMTT